MFRRLLPLVRAYVGGVALAMGCVGLFLFVVSIPFTFLGAHFLEGSSAAQPDGSVSRLLEWVIDHRLTPLFVISFVLVAYGFYEAHVEQNSKR
jgi:hypothetical protein